MTKNVSKMPFTSAVLTCVHPNSGQTYQIELPRSGVLVFTQEFTYPEPVEILPGLCEQPMAKQKLFTVELEYAVDVVEDPGPVYTLNLQPPDDLNATLPSALSCALFELETANANYERVRAKNHELAKERDRLRARLDRVQKG